MPRKKKAAQKTPMRRLSKREDSCLREVMIAMLCAGAPIEVVFAHLKTGLLLVPDFWHNYDEDVKNEWSTAIAEFWAAWDQNHSIGEMHLSAPKGTSQH